VIGNAVDDAGIFTEEAGAFLQGKEIFGEGTQAVVDHIKQTGRLLHHSIYKHRYPYDWRTKQPVIQRATSQWFCKLDGLQGKALDALEKVNIIPNTGRARLTAFVRGRKEWCISRQRAWGVPIPVFYREDGEPVLNRSIVEHVLALVNTHGADCWWQLETDELLPEEYKGQNLTRGSDTLDVWFDSGVSWQAALKPRGIPSPADLYVEGSDQHRGWFQSSLLTSVAVKDAAPYKAILTHGFVLDQHMHKMSKSLGNVIEPFDLISAAPKAEADSPLPSANKHEVEAAMDTSKMTEEEIKAARKARKKAKKDKKAKKKTKQQGEQAKYGVDALRLWVASTDFTSDVTIGPEILEKANQVYYKFRTVCRFLLGNLKDFDASMIVPFKEMEPLDRYMLQRLAQFNSAQSAAYEMHNFSKVTSLTTEFMTTTLSSLYLEIVKDRLYLETPNNISRRSCQTVLLHVFENLTKAMSPVLCHISEEMHDHIPNSLAATMNRSSVEASGLDSCFTKGWLFSHPDWMKEEEDFIATALTLRAEVFGFVEKLRQNSKLGIKSALETEVTIRPVVTSAAGRSMLETLGAAGVEKALSQIFICSVVKVSAADSILPVDEEEVQYGVKSLSFQGEEVEVQMSVRKSRLLKCQRCWAYKVEPPLDGTADEICSRCEHVLSELAF